jgi:aminopeptidase
MIMVYTPDKKILAKYADVMVNFALNKGKGLRPGKTVLLIIWENAKPLLRELKKEITKAGGNLILKYMPDDEARYTISPELYKLASKKQLSFVPEKYFDGIVAEADHIMTVLSENPQILSKVDPKKVAVNVEALSTFRKKYFEKENSGKLSWTLCIYGTPELANEAGLSQREYWNQITRACFLDRKNPVAEWRKTDREIGRVKNKLSSLKIERLHIVSKNVDLWLKIGKNRKWLSGSGVNIPSFEIFTSPDWRGTEGKIAFNMPLYYNGNRIEGIKLEFKKGRVVKSGATRNERVLKEMIKNENADKVGEFSLTDGRVSRITKFMANTLFDENIGGKEGNTHIALGNSYRTTFSGNSSSLKESDWKRFGFNQSKVHTDMFSTEKREVVAYLTNGQTKIIYKNGKFLV